MKCPYCNGKLEEVDIEKSLDDLQPSIMIIFECKDCGKSPAASFYFEDDWIDEEGNNI